MAPACVSPTVRGLKAAGRGRPLVAELRPSPQPDPEPNRSRWPRCSAGLTGCGRIAAGRDGLRSAALSRSADGPPKGLTAALGKSPAAFGRTFAVNGNLEPERGPVRLARTSSRSPRLLPASLECLADARPAPPARFNASCTRSCSRARRRWLLAQNPCEHAGSRAYRLPDRSK